MIREVLAIDRFVAKAAESCDPGNRQYVGLRKHNNHSQPTFHTFGCILLRIGRRTCGRIEVRRYACVSSLGQLNYPLRYVRSGLEEAVVLAYEEEIIRMPPNHAFNAGRAGTRLLLG